jgi:LacI family transcriptional regulator
MRTLTIHDVAKLAEVSAKTVSRVLNDEPNVREEVRARVRAAAAQLNFRPNMSARRLRGSSSRLIAALADAPLTLDHLQSDHGGNFLNRFQLGAMRRCRDSAFHLLVELVDLGQPDVDGQVLALLSALKPDGVILTPPSCDNGPILDVLERTGTPFVRFGPQADAGRGSSVFIDEVAAANEMTRHLAAAGHRDIAFIVGSPRFASAQARLQGFRDAMKALGLRVREAWIRPGDFTFQAGQSCGAALLAGAELPTAVFASNDEMALGVMHAAAAAGLSVPGDISIVGFDDTISARFSIPPLTTIRQPVTEMSMQAADLLISQVTGKAGAETSVQRQSPYELVVRGSVARPVMPRARRTRGAAA